MKYASVCSGVEAASLAWMPLGWEAVWFSEIEPFPCAVLKERFPSVPNLGDMTKIKVETLDNGDQRFTNDDDADVIVRGGVDLLVGGTPCQSFSVAGKREGLDGESGLARTFVQLLESMQPRWFVWENVPGCLSSRNKQTGIYDFNFLLAAFAEVGYTCGWRILDAQFCRVDGFPRAVPQRRRRVFVVGHLGAEWQYPAEVVFEPHSLFGNTPPCRVKGKGFTADAQRSVGTASWDRCISLIPYGIASTIARIDAKFPQCVCTTGRPWDASGVNPTLNQCNGANGAPGQSNQELFCSNIASTIDARMGQNQGTDNQHIFSGCPNFVIENASAFNGAGMESGEVTPTLQANLGKLLSNQTPIILNDQGGSVMQIEKDGTAGTLRANTHGNEQIVCVHGAETPICNAEGFGNPVTANHNGLENCVCQKTAAFMGGQGAKAGGIVYSDEFSPTLKSDAGGNTVPDVVCWAAGGFGQKVKSDIAATISTDHDDRVTGNNAALIQESYSVDRRNQTLTEDDAVPCDVCGKRPDVYRRWEGECTIACDHCIAKDTITAASEHEAVRLWNERNTRSSSAVVIAENIIGRQVHNGGNGTGAQEELAYTQNTSGVMGVASHATVRRLLPIECERLMGFPDNWTRIPWKGKPEEECPDSPRYKACGNSMCVNVMRWIGLRIEMMETKEINND